MSHIKLLGDLDTSPYCCKIRIVLGEKNIPYDYISKSISGDANLVIAHNPLGMVPVLVVDDQQAIFDSRVIVGYLEALSPSPALLPTGGMERVAVRRWEALGDGICDAGRARYHESKQANKDSASVISKQTGKFERGLERVSKELGDNQWCHGNAYSLADIAIGTAIAWVGFRFPEIDPRKRYANLHGLYERLMQRPPFAFATKPFN